MNKMLAVMAGLALAGCETSSVKPDPTPDAQPAAVDTQGQRATDSHEEKAPLLLSLQALSDEAGVLELQANLDAQNDLGLPVTLSVTLPETPLACTVFAWSRFCVSKGPVGA